MKKIVLIVLFFVLLGGIINLIVAAICSGLGPPIRLMETIVVDEAGLELWKRYAKDDWPTNPGTAMFGSRFGLVLTDWSAIVNVGDNPPLGYRVWREQAGWPMLSVAAFGRSGNKYYENLSGILGLPFQPIWIGYLINTFIYGGVVAFGFFWNKSLHEMAAQR